MREPIKNLFQRLWSSLRPLHSANKRENCLFSLDLLGSVT